MPKLTGFVIIEAMAAVAITGLLLAAIIKLGAIGKYSEKLVYRRWQKGSEINPLINGKCREENISRNLRLYNCSIGENKKYYITYF